ncbi:hypothetical protein FSOLCH5_010226 [Fusarium solani]
MRLPTLLAGLFACLITDVAATALTYKLGANEKACFYTATKKGGREGRILLCREPHTTPPYASELELNIKL